MVYSCEYCGKFIANNKIDTEEVKLIYSSDWESLYDERGYAHTICFEKKLVKESLLKLEIKSLTEQGKENELWRLYL